MKQQEVNFIKTLSQHANSAFQKAESPRRKAFFAWGRAAGAIVSIVLFVGLAYAAKAVMTGTTLSQQFGNSSVFEQLKHLVGSEDRPLAGEPGDRINILLLGIGGDQHQGGMLSDTIMVVSIEPSAKRVGLLSIPRDLVVPIPEVGWQKINAANAYGAAQNPTDRNAGPALAKQTIQQVTGLDMHYYIKMDFNGFVKVIDALGGIDVQVPQSFTDYQYPDNAYGYDPVHFEAGLRHFNGDMALKYARSRHGTNQEGSDFARARRQQQILRSLQNRAMGISTLLNPNKLLSLADIVSGHLQTDMEIWESFRLFELIKDVEPDSIAQVVLSAEKDGLLMVDTNEEGAYLLRPRAGAGNFDEIKQAAQSLLAAGAPAVAPTLAASEATNAKPAYSGALRVTVLNGTTHPGLASRTAERIRSLSYAVVNIANAPQQNFERTVIYASNRENAAVQEAVARIRAELNANVAVSVPAYFTDIESEVVVVVGTDTIE